MKISRVSIEGYKSIRNQTINLNDLNIIIGSNGIGKSNFISFFEFAKDIYNNRLQRSVIENDGAGKLLYMGVKTTKELSFGLDFQEENIRHQYSVSLSLAQDTLIINKATNTCYREGKLDYQFEERDSKELNPDEWDLPKSYLGPLTSSLEVYHFQDTSVSSLMKQKQSIDDDRKLRTDGSNIASFLYRLQMASPKHFMRIESTIRSIAPFFQRFSLIPNRQNENLISLEWEPTSSGKDVVFNAYQMSDGTLRFICLATLLMQPEPPSVIIIDEPEIGLHPQAINKLAAIIKRASKQSQIIISTQSNYFIDHFEPEDILVAERYDNATEMHRLSAEQLKDWRKEYSLGELWEMNVFGGQPI